MNVWADLESALDVEATFPVEKPDGRKELTELMRAVRFRGLMRAVAPRVFVFANANAGKRNPRQAAAEGVLAGCPDYTCLWYPPRDVSDRCTAYVELKGYSSKGQPGKLSRAQIEFGNRLDRMGFPVACFFSPENAVEWLRGVGAPVTGRFG